jgi:hypothetical protein
MSILAYVIPYLFPSGLLASLGIYLSRKSNKIGVPLPQIDVDIHEPLVYHPPEPRIIFHYYIDEAVDNYIDMEICLYRLPMRTSIYMVKTLTKDELIDVCVEIIICRYRDTISIKYEDNFYQWDFANNTIVGKSDSILYHFRIKPRFFLY